MPTLPPNVAVCDGIPRGSWNTKYVTLRNKVGDDVARGNSHSVDADLVIDMDGKPLVEDRIAIQIVESLCEAEVPLGWMWSMHSWHIKQVYLNGASLYDQHQTDLYNSAVNASRRRKRVGVCAYESSRERRELENTPKKEILLTMQAITEVSTKNCC